MSMLILGLLIWSVAHLFKAVAPGSRLEITERLGAGASRILFTVLIVAGLLAMIFGYRAAPFVPVWTSPSWTIHLNNLLMLAAVAVYGMSMSKGRTRAWFRHPQLTAVVIWAAAHLLVNGDLASLILFGGLGAWAVAEMLRINARDGAWVRPEPGPAKRDLVLVAVTLVLFGVITSIHAWLGYWPFPQ